VLRRFGKATGLTRGAHFGTFLSCFLGGILVPLILRPFIAFLQIRISCKSVGSHSRVAPGISWRAAPGAYFAASCRAHTARCRRARVLDLLRPWSMRTLASKSFTVSSAVVGLHPEALPEESAGQQHVRPGNRRPLRPVSPSDSAFLPSANCTAESPSPKSRPVNALKALGDHRCARQQLRPLAAQSRDDPEQYSLPARITSGTHARRISRWRQRWASAALSSRRVTPALGTRRSLFLAAHWQGCRHHHFMIPRREP